MAKLEAVAGPSPIRNLCRRRFLESDHALSCVRLLPLRGTRVNQLLTACPTSVADQSRPATNLEVSLQAKACQSRSFSSTLYHVAEFKGGLPAYEDADLCTNTLPNLQTQVDSRIGRESCTALPRFLVVTANPFPIYFDRIIYL